MEHNNPLTNMPIDNIPHAMGNQLGFSRLYCHD